jgi:hypothetical protein
VTGAASCRAAPTPDTATDTEGDTDTEDDSGNGGEPTDRGSRSPDDPGPPTLFGDAA